MTRDRPDRLPTYVLRSGEQVFAPPYNMDQTGLHILLVRASEARLRQVIDVGLNAPWQEAFSARGVFHHYVPTYNWVAFVFASVKELRPDTRGEPQPVFRSMKEQDLYDIFRHTVAVQRELLIMIPVTDDYRGRPGDYRSAQRRTVWYLPLVFNDFAPSIIAGREVYGYPKQYAEFVAVGRLRRTAAPDFGSKPLWRRLEMRAFVPVPAPASARPDGGAWYELGLQTVLAVHRGGRPLESVGGAESREYEPPVTPVADIEIVPEPIGSTSLPTRADEGRALLVDPPNVMTASATADPDGASAKSIEQLADLLDRPMEYLFLRQFRDPSITARASYQAVVQGAITTSVGGAEIKWNAGTNDDKGYFLRFPPPGVYGLDNPIADALGLPEIVKADAVRYVADASIVVERANIVWDRS